MYLRGGDKADSEKLLTVGWRGGKFGKQILIFMYKLSSILFDKVYYKNRYFFVFMILKTIFLIWLLLSDFIKASKSIL